MHSAIVSTVCRCCMDAHKKFSEKNPEYHIPAWGLGLLTTTAILYLFTQFRVEYTYGRMVPTLLMIESPVDGVNYESLPIADKDASLKNKLADEEVASPSKNRFLTSSLRATALLLQAKGGFHARLRGLSIFLVQLVVIEFGSTLINQFTVLPMFACTILATVLAANLSLTWTHIVVTDPSPKPWFKRVNVNAWRRVAAPTMVFATAKQATALVTVDVARSLMGVRINNPTLGYDHLESSLLWKSLVVFTVGLVLSIVLIIPANVMLTRVQASILDDTEETIVSFDRTFNGKVLPQAVGGTGALSMRDAWSTFDWDARRRLLIVYAKVVAIQMAVIVFFACAFVAQVFFIIGSDWQKLNPQQHSAGVPA